MNFNSLWRQIKHWWPPRPRYRRPAMILHWHGGRAALDARGGVSGDPVGLKDLATARVSHVVVPQINRVAEYPGGEWLQRNTQILRGIEQKWNPGLNKTNLGAVMLSFKKRQDPGPFISALVEHVQGPCDGLAWNMEHPVTNIDQYPLTEEDRRVWDRVGRTRFDLVSFRCYQFAAIYKMIFAATKYRHPTCAMAVAYSAYAADGAKPRYGCDFTALDTFDFWRGLYLPAITHAMCNRASVDLPKAHWTTDHTLPVLHTISTHPDTPSGDKIAAYRKTLQSRLRRLPQGDGIGMVHAEMTPHWTDADRDVCQVAGDVLATL